MILRRTYQSNEVPSKFSEVALTRRNPSDERLPKREKETVEYLKSLVEAGMYEVNDTPSTFKFSNIFVSQALAEDIAMALSTESDNVQVEPVGVDNA